LRQHIDSQDYYQVATPYLKVYLAHLDDFIQVQFEAWLTSLIQDTYNAYALAYNESIVLTNAERLATLGFRDLGYRVVIFDDAMTELNRSANGTLIANAGKFPSGLRNISDQLHSYGLEFGVYSSAGRFTCGGYPGSLGYETQDAQWWASMGADYLKYDNCYNEGLSGTPKISQDRYAAMSNALNSTDRAFAYSLCNWGDDKVWYVVSTRSVCDSPVQPVLTIRSELQGVGKHHRQQRTDFGRYPRQLHHVLECLSLWAG
jgi:hypothetical protein